MKTLREGDYVLATKWHDGDSQDSWCVGFYKETYNHFGNPRHIVVDAEGNPFRANGFKRVKHISKTRGAWIIKHKKEIEQSGRSLRYFARCPMKLLP